MGQLVILGSEMTLRIYIEATDFRGIRATKDTLSPMMKARFLHLTILVAQSESNPSHLDYQAYLSNHS